MPTAPWLWINRRGAISCGGPGCRPSTSPGGWGVLSQIELAELGALATANKTTVHCICGGVEYDPASRTVRERHERESNA